MRLFVAVFPPPSSLAALHAALPPGSRFTAVSKWHLTLVFLGEAPAPAVASLLAEVPTPGPFWLRLIGGGRFGAVAWAGVDGDLTRLAELRDGVRDALTMGGFPTDNRPFHPHLTVSYHQDAPLRRALVGYAGEPFEVTSFALMESVDGRYEQIESWPL